MSNIEENDTCDLKISESDLSHIIKNILNIFLHVTILFTFLTFLFKVLISPLAKGAFRGEIGHMIESAVNNTIPDKIDLTNMTNTSDFKQKLENVKMLLKLYKSTIPQFSELSDDNQEQIINILILNYDNIITKPTYLNKYIKAYSTPNYLINIHDDDTMGFALSISGALFIISILLIGFVKYSCKDCVNVSKLVTENVITFIFVGIVEFWFFTHYAFKFVPAPPSLLVSSSLDNVKEIINK